jgi:hypothetical protein
VRVARRVREGTCGRRPVATPTPRPQVYLTHDRIGEAGIRSAEDLRQKAENALRRLQRLPGLVCAFFLDPHIRYAQAV